MKLGGRLKKLEDHTKLIEPSDPINVADEEAFQCYLEVFNNYLQEDHEWHRLNDDTKYELAKTFTSRFYHNGNLPSRDKRRYEKLLPEEFIFMEMDLIHCVKDAIRDVQRMRIGGE